MSEPQPKLADALALERTRMAADRTLMGWIRTALSMISFGFTIFKFLEYIQEQSITPLRRAHGPREVGIIADRHRDLCSDHCLPSTLAIL